MKTIVVTIAITEEQLAAIKAWSDRSWSRMVPNVRALCELVIEAARARR